MRKQLMSVAGGAALCCGTFGYCALPSTDALTFGAWSTVLLCHGFGGYVAAGGLDASRDRSAGGVIACIALGAMWTLLQAGVAASALRLLAPPLSPAASGWMLGTAATSLVMLALSWTRADLRSCEGQRRSP